MNVTGASNSGGEWKGTEWRIATADGARTCANTQNKNSSPASDSFSVTAPAGVGVYDLYLVARGEDACTGGKSALFTLAGAVTVGGGSVCGNGTIEGGEQCDDGNTANGDGCESDGAPAKVAARHGWFPLSAGMASGARRPAVAP